MNKKDLIKESAYKLFADYGYDGTSISAIAKSSGLQKANLYFYYPKKEELLLELIREEAENLLNHLSKNLEATSHLDVEKRLFYTFKYSLQYFCKDKYRAKFVSHFLFMPYKTVKDKIIDELDYFSIKIHSKICDLFTYCVDKNLIDLSVEDSINFYHWFSNVCIFRYIQEDVDVFDDNNLKKCWNFFWKGIKK